VLEPILAAWRLASSPFLLHGVTGSGKTEVYFRARGARPRGRTALILVPEIALTPLLCGPRSARFGRPWPSLHSELSAGERHDQWWRIREASAGGHRRALRGVRPYRGRASSWSTRSTRAYKQDESPRLPRRDVAVMRGTLEGAGGARLGHAVRRVVAANARRESTALLLPRASAPRACRGSRWWTAARSCRRAAIPILTRLLREALVAPAPARAALLLLNRRGYATSLLCRECGSRPRAPTARSA
jgi:primosomal protein N' (replication factor Y)